MSVDIIHFNDKVHNAGGVEVYLSQLQPLLNAQDYKSSWLGIERANNQNYIVRAHGQQTAHTVTLKNLGHFLENISQSQRRIYHIHSISDPVLLELLFAHGPVIRTMHEPRLFCPGQGKFWRTDEVPCTIPAGLHCIYHAYKKRCCNRHPQRLLKAFSNTQYEIKNASQKYSAIIANSGWTAKEAILAGFPKQKITVIPYFTEKVKPTSIPKNFPPRVLFVGRLTKEKGLHYLLFAIKQFLDNGLNLQVDIVGDGHEKLFFEEIIQKLGLNDVCTLHGWLGREKIREKIQSSTVVAFPSIYPEAFGIVGIEAMMQARPVVAFDVGGVQDWLQDGVTGILVEPKKCDKFFVALSKICQNYEYASQLGKNSYLVALEKFSPKNHLASLSKVYDQVFV